MEIIHSETGWNGARGAQLREQILLLNDDIELVGTDVRTWTT